MPQKLKKPQKTMQHGPVVMTQKEFDRLIGRITEGCEPISGWFPTADETDTLIHDLPGRETLDFCIWITESNPDMKLTDIQKENRKRLRRAVSESVIIKE